MDFPIAVEAPPMWQLGCTGEFACDCPQKIREFVASTEPENPHGKRSTYNAGCRCLACGLANSAYIKAYKKRKSAHGTA